MDRRRFLIIVAGDAKREYNAECPAIVPILGEELLANPGMEGTYEDESSGGGTAMLAPNWDRDATFVVGTDQAQAEASIVHGGAESQKVVVASGTQAGIQSSVNIAAANQWYQLGGWVYGVSGTNIEIIVDNIRPNWTSSGAWEELYGTGINTASARRFRVRAKAGNQTFYVDDMSAKLINFASTLKYLVTRSNKNGTYICHPTAAAATVAGMVICYKDASNHVVAVVDRNNVAQAKLYRCISGTYTLTISGNITYSNGTELKVVNNGGTYTLYYNNIQVGSPTAIAEATLGTEVHGFNTFAGNAVGVVTTSPF